MAVPDYSFVIPVFDEEDNLEELYRRLTAVLDRLDGPAEVLLIDDGSSDRSYEVMLSLHERDPRYKALSLSRNFGHQIAITAGVDHSRGRAVIIMDADLQDPPELVIELAARWREGYDVVYGVRETRAGEPGWKRRSTYVYYRLLRRLTDLEIPADAGDFRLVDRRAVDAVAGLRESNRYLRGLYTWVGFRQVGVPYERPGRHAGVTKYPFRKLAKLAADGVVSFSNVPLRLALNLGFVVSLLAFVAGIASIVLKVAGVYSPPGWASQVVFTSLIGGVQLIVIGVMGEYVGRIYEEVKRRPLYFLSDSRGITAADANGQPDRRFAPADVDRPLK